MTALSEQPNDQLGFRCVRKLRFIRPIHRDDCKWDWQGTVDYGMIADDGGLVRTSSYIGALAVFVKYTFSL